MTAIVVHLRRWEQRRLVRLMRTTREAGIRTRVLIVLHAAGGKSTAHIADAVGYDPSAVLKVLHRFAAEGEDGLRDHREDNGHAKVDDAMWGTLATLLVALLSETVLLLTLLALISRRLLRPFCMLIAMGNAVESVRAAARAIVADNDHDGVPYLGAVGS